MCSSHHGLRRGRATQPLRPPIMESMNMLDNRCGKITGDERAPPQPLRIHHALTQHRHTRSLQRADPICSLEYMLTAVAPVAATAGPPPAHFLITDARPAYNQIYRNQRRDDDSASCSTRRDIACPQPDRATSPAADPTPRSDACRWDTGTSPPGRTSGCWPPPWRTRIRRP